MEFTSIKGFKDILPEEAGLWQKLEAGARGIFHAFGFQEIKPPVLERTELFSRGIGQETDIVAKEMYSFQDAKGRGLTLRPEATAGLVRAYIQHRLYEKSPIQKLFTIGPMFRRERPQKGRFRQFHQIDVEIFGDPGPKSDAEIMVMAVALIEIVGLPHLTLYINSLGCPLCRMRFREELRNYLTRGSAKLCEDCQRRAETNPLRVFDCKVEGCGDAVSGAPSILEFICEACRDHFGSVQDYLEISQIPFVINHKLVRGLDYYTRTTFELQTERLGAQNAVLGGGRYDGLVQLLGGPDHPGIGFAIGMERLVDLMDQGGWSGFQGPELFIAALGPKAEKKAFTWVNGLRRSGIWVETEYGPKGLKVQMKRADRLHAKRVLIVGDAELESGKGILRDMVAKGQKEVMLDGLTEEMKRELDRG